MAQAYDYLVYIGRFQPFHNSHLAMLQQALAQADKVVLVLGSAGGPRTTRNPFTAAERREMIALALGEAAGRIVFVETRDYYNTPRWVAAVRKAVAAAVPAQASVGLFGHLKDRSSSYLRDFPDWPLVHVDNVGGLNASDLRQQWFAAEGDAAVLQALVPAPVQGFLAAFAQRPEFAALLSEYHYLQHYRADWAKAPYAPVFVTVDTIIRCCDRVLLIKRGGQPGHGCWALPGGFLDQHERVADAAIRELNEETEIALPQALLDEARRGSALFDHPDRSIRGRTLTHAFYFELPLTSLPEIKAADDAAAARWVPIAELAQLEDQMFEDHLIILDHFLKLLE